MNAALIAGAGALGGAGLVFRAGMHPQSQLFGPTVRFTGDTGSIAITFDDGPNPAATPALLDLFDKYQGRATFFLIGGHVRAFPALAREVASRGHLIGNHTETHPNLTFLSPKTITRELTLCGEAIESAVGMKPRWMRPPYGFRGPQLRGVIRRMGYSGVAMWSKLAWDWNPQPAEPVIHRLQTVTGGDIVLLHDGDHRTLEGDRKHTVDALAYWLPRWKDAGLRFVTLDAIEGAARANLSAGDARGKS
ncbi:MAG TPA: polysaccharide deacetylase family protein [Candidatus Acidoferrales bacterium]|nr:polysaccharide deacetylase family protein [Candidatus Acidoferrales bacterium]